jgi:predicted DCC family thiol-disulfide oxidoreductase YuxK
MISVNTELTDIKEFSGWVLYDEDCRFCVALARRFRAPLAIRHFQLLPLQTPWVLERLKISNQDWMAEMRLLKPDNSVFGGADALLEIGRQFRWTWPIRQLARYPSIRNAFHGMYRWVARHRDCARGACAMAGKPAHKPGRISAYLPLLVLPPLVLLLRANLEPWVFMWAMSFALMGGNVWGNLHSSLWPVSPSVAGLASSRREGLANHAVSAGVKLAYGILGDALECGVP